MLVIILRNSNYELQIVFSLLAFHIDVVQFEKDPCFAEKFKILKYIVNNEIAELCLSIKPICWLITPL